MKENPSLLNDLLEHKRIKFVNRRLQYQKMCVLINGCFQRLMLIYIGKIIVLFDFKILSNH